VSQPTPTPPHTTTQSQHSTHPLCQTVSMWWRCSRGDGGPSGDKLDPDFCKHTACRACLHLSSTPNGDSPLWRVHSQVGIPHWGVYSPMGGAQWIVYTTEVSMDVSLAWHALDTCKPVARQHWRPCKMHERTCELYDGEP
jgi:hypothetical protein